VSAQPLPQVGSREGARQVPTSALKDGVVAVNFSSAKNFEGDIKEKVRPLRGPRLA
jgi:hypothetical protein